MMPFNKTQNKALAAKLSAKYVRTRVKDGITLTYIEGWHAIAEANRIFGFDCWNRETVRADCVWQGANNGKSACSYTAQVRVSVRAGDSVICREGCGSGSGFGKSLGEAHEKALKEAETDAMKRALSTFGNPFGLALYDKEQKCVKQSRSRQAGKPLSWSIFGSEGKKISDYYDPIDFCSSMKQNLEAINDCSEFMAFWRNNQEMVAKLREFLPDLQTEQGRHYGAILSTLYTTRLQEFAAKKSKAKETVKSKSKIEVGKEEIVVGNTAINLNPDTVIPSPSGTNTAKPIPPHCKRVRNKEHLRFVSSKSCLICGRSPSHAHHIKFAQPRAMGRKVSDEWVVPLCYIHHRALHERGDEKAWWEQNKIDPIEEAERLWEDSHNCLRVE
jgi:DNA recombination protein Rad52